MHLADAFIQTHYIAMSIHFCCCLSMYMQSLGANPCLGIASYML